MLVDVAWPLDRLISETLQIFTIVRKKRRYFDAVPCAVAQLDFHLIKPLGRFLKDQLGRRLWRVATLCILYWSEFVNTTVLLE